MIVKKKKNHSDKNGEMTLIACHKHKRQKKRQKQKDYSPAAHPLFQKRHLMTAHANLHTGVFIMEVFSVTNRNLFILEIYNY